MLAALVACSRPLPEEGSEAATLYRERCGTTCHRAYSPASVRPALWEMIVPQMEQRMRAARLPSLTAQERTTILDYLRRHAVGSAPAAPSTSPGAVS